MTRDETLTVLAVIRAAYPAFYGKANKQDIDISVNLWSEMFADDSYQVVNYALKQLIAEKTGFPPCIADLKQKIRDVTTAATGAPTHEELWQMLRAATRNGLYGSEEEFAKLPPVLKRYLGAPSALRVMAVMDEDVLNSVVHGQFLKQISAIEDRERFDEEMPDNIRQLACSMAHRIPETHQLTEGEVNDRRNRILDKVGG